ncbi:MAG: hypothetical protein HKP55_08835 [Gammaproteobacteria bacterium]|nr:hypothetical protein [Gammaproteobacteria bacterium]
MTRNNKRIAITLWAITALLTASQLQAGSRQASYWLEKMMKAVHEMNYDGNFVYLHGDNIESLRTVHINQDGHEIERLFSLNGEAREIVRDNETVTRILPNDKTIATTQRLLNKQSFSGFFVLDLERIEQNYEINLKGRGRIADRATNIIDFAPRDHLRYGFRLHVDDESALPLQWEMFDQQQQLVSRIMFTSISVGSNVTDSGSLLEQGDSDVIKKKSAVVSSNGQSTDINSKWSFNKLPQGFVIKHHHQGIPDKKSRNIEHYIFSDGISSFSVYIEQTNKVRLDGNAHLGALNAYGVFVNGHQVTAVGEVPPETLAFISELAISND